MLSFVPVNPSGDSPVLYILTPFVNIVAGELYGPPNSFGVVGGTVTFCVVFPSTKVVLKFFPPIFIPVPV